MKHLTLLFLWLLQASFNLRAEQIMIPAANSFILTESHNTESVRKLKVAAKPKKELTELKKLRRKKALLIAAVILLPLATMISGGIAVISVALVEEGTMPTVNATTLISGLFALLFLFVFVKSVIKLIRVSKAIEKEKTRLKQLQKKTQ